MFKSEIIKPILLRIFLVKMKFTNVSGTYLGKESDQEFNMWFDFHEL